MCEKYIINDKHVKVVCHVNTLKVSNFEIFVITKFSEYL